jgi:HPt (histidine-containing phosphotransfer) domain-containing protein
MSTHWDRATALKRLGGDESLLQELVAIFFEDYPKLSERLRQGLARGDFASVRQAAHALKGSLQYIGFTDAAELALAIEQANRAEDAAKAEGLASALTMEIEAVQQTMASTGERKHGPVSE